MSDKPTSDIDRLLKAFSDLLAQMAYAKAQRLRREDSFDDFKAPTPTEPGT